MRLSGADIQDATGGCWRGPVPDMLNNIVTDTRDFQAGGAFLALHGPSFDGHSFAVSIAKMATALIGDKKGIQAWADLNTSILEVDDTLQAFGDIAHAWRQRLHHTTVIAITGSYGKTSLRSLLETGFRAFQCSVSATHANLNNLIGVPQTLLAVPANSDIAIIECGVSESGEMSRLATMVQPDISILTGISAAHAEGLGDLAAIASEKALLLDGSSWCGLGAGVETLLTDNHITVSQPLLSVDKNSQDSVLWDLCDCHVQFTYQDQLASMELTLPAPHWAANIAFAAAIMLRFFNSSSHDQTTLKDVIAALSQWQPQTGRLQSLTGRHGALLLDDCYNANPASMHAAMITLRALKGRRIAILGDMAELGDASATAHINIDLSDLDHVYLIGPNMFALAISHPKADWFADTDKAIAALAHTTFTATDSVLIKASRSMQLEKIVRLLRRQEVSHAV